MPEVEKTESEAASLVDVDSPHISSVESDFKDKAVKTKTQATRMEHEAEDKAREASKKVSDTASEARKKASVEKDKAKDKAKAGGKKLQENSDNPVVIGNAIIMAVGATALGFAAYNRYSEGKLDGEAVAMGAGIVGAFAVADYFASQYVASVDRKSATWVRSLFESS